MNILFNDIIKTIVIDCISLSTNILGKGMNPIIIPPGMG